MSCRFHSLFSTVVFLFFTLENLLIGYSYVRGLERRVKELEQQLATSLTPQNSQVDSSSHIWEQIVSENATNTSPPVQIADDSMPNFEMLPISPTVLDHPVKMPDSLVEELRLLSLEAAAERYLGSSSGLSLAKLTQTVLQRLSPDQDGFVFDEETDGAQPETCDIEILDPVSNLNPVFFDMDPSLTSPLNSLFGNPAIDDDFEDTLSLSLIDPAHINYILEFYFAHSHTLYPIIRKNDFEAVLRRVYSNPMDPLAQSPLWQFRIWMILAIGSTTYCSVSLMDESEPVQYFNKAMTYFESAMGCGELVSSLELWICKDRECSDNLN